MSSSSHTAEKSSSSECQKEKDIQGCHHGDTNTAKCEHSHHQMDPEVAWLYEATHKGNRPPEETCKIYDQHADDYEKFASKFTCEEWSLVVTDVIETKILKDKSCRILDVGAGTGANGNLLQKHGYTNIDALDGSEQMLEIAKTKNIYHNLIHIILKDGVRIPNVENDTYTAVVMNAVFCPNHCDSSIFPELIRVVKPGGYISWSLKTDEETDVDKFNSDVEKLCEERKWKSIFEKIHKTEFGDEKVVIMEVL
ncbi:uncharacterized protein LOC106472740 [Limulus polyphemus]|uniref:Uncharacterized protein LOC106472740 n=1 Tax=Limulus polyphemus TaxID=6850 RepID=A0ABM1BUE1_LIMPO|nr:uncharacterized protein LOC106472740 [Limulus polyphemus]